MDIRVVDKAGFQVVGMSWSGPYSQMEQIPRLFSEFRLRVDEILYPTGDDVIIALFHCRETDLTYYVAAPVVQIAEVPDGMTGFLVPEKSYVFACHNGPKVKLEETYIKMSEWMKEYGYEQDQFALGIEIHPITVLNKRNTSEPMQIDIYLPIKKYGIED